MHDLTDIAAQNRQREAEKVQAARELHQQKEDFMELMSTRAGRRFIKGLLVDCGIFQSSYTGSAETYFREGRRDIGLKVLARINDWCPHLYSTLMQEK